MDISYVTHKLIIVFNLYDGDKRYKFQFLITPKTRKKGKYYILKYLKIVIISHTMTNTMITHL